MSRLYYNSLENLHYLDNFFCTNLKKALSIDDDFTYLVAFTVMFSHQAKIWAALDSPVTFEKVMTTSFSDACKFFGSLGGLGHVLLRVLCCDD